MKMKKISKDTLVIQELVDKLRREDQVHYVLGLDLSYSSTGIVLLEVPTDTPLHANNVKAGKPGDNFSVRVDAVANQILSVLSVCGSCKDRVLIVIEGASYASDFGAFKLGELTGTISYILEKSGYKIIRVAPTAVKKFVTGKGNANKDLMGVFVRDRWAFTHKSNDVVDAYALAKHGINLLGNTP